MRRGYQRYGRALAGAVLTILIASSAAGCSGDDDKPSETKSSSDPAPAKAKANAKRKPTGIAKDPAVQIPRKVPNDPDKRLAVTVTRCKHTKSGWTAKGTAKAGGDRDARYRITIFFTNEQATVLQWGKAKVDVPAGGTANWRVNGNLNAKAGVLCALRGVA